MRRLSCRAGWRLPAQRGDGAVDAKLDNRFVERVGIDDSARPIDHGLAALGEHGFRSEHGGDRTGDLAR